MEGYYAQASHSCNYCSKVVATYGELVEHKKTHVGDRPFSCHICHKRFTQKAHLNIHKRTHTGEKPYACTVCHKRFSQSSHLNSHRRIHASDRPYFCVVCNTGFSQKHRFDSHLPCMQHQQAQQLSRSSARLSLAFSSPSPSQGHMPSSSSASQPPPAAYGGGGMEDETEVDQKPDVKYLEALNQQALMQQLTEMSNAATQDGPGGVKDDGGGVLGEEGYDATNNSLLAGGGGGGRGDLLAKEESRSSLSAACMPTMTSHRRKPAFIRHVDSVDDAAGSRRDGDTEVSEMANSFGGGGGQEDNGYPDFSFHNGTTPASSSSLGHKMGRGEGLSNTTTTSSPVPANKKLLPTRTSPAATSSSAHNLNGGGGGGGGAEENGGQTAAGGLVARSNHRISLVNFTAEELLQHLTSRSDVHRCDFCRLIFQDAAMYHIHRNMHDKNDLRRCNFCGKMLQDRYDFTAHFLSEHR